MAWFSSFSSRPGDCFKDSRGRKGVTVSISVIDVDEGGSNGRVEASKSALELIEVQLAVSVLVEGAELAGGVSAHEGES